MNDLNVFYRRNLEFRVVRILQKPVGLCGMRSYMFLGLRIEGKPRSNDVFVFIFRQTNTIVHDIVQLKEVLGGVGVITELASFCVERNLLTQTIGVID